MMEIGEMSMNDPHTDLTSLFAAEDRALNPEPFVTRVSVRIARKRIWRKAVLLGAGCFGGLVALVQIPVLIPDVTSASGFVKEAMSALTSASSSLGTVSPMWLAFSVLILVGGALVVTER